MGCAQSSERRRAKRRSDEIDKQLRSWEADSRKQFTILLFGSGGAGKSTVLKQVKLIYDGPYSQDEREKFRPIIFSDIVQSMRIIFDGMQRMELTLDGPEAEHHIQTIFAQPPRQEGNVLPPEVGQAIKFMWGDTNVRTAVQRGDSYGLSSNVNHFFDHIDRISSPSYLPDDQDILLSCTRTFGHQERTFMVDGLTHHVIHLGGSQTERRKWIHCFDNVTTILFLAAISEYDQPLFEDFMYNRMQEAVVLFDSICNSRWFTKTTILLFLNKIDLLKDKLHTSPLKKSFPDYQGGADYAAACDYIRNKFVSVDHASNRHIYTHFTCAINTMQMRNTMAKCYEICVKENLRMSNLV